MKTIILILFLLNLLHAQSKIALVIGNQNYANHTGLENPIADAKMIGDRLRSMGFEVLESYDANLESLDDQLKVFNMKAYQSEVALIFYAGHGIGVDGVNYLIPIGSQDLSKINLRRKLLSVDELMEAVAKAKSFGVVLFDACRSSFFAGKIEGIPNSRGGRGLTQIQSTRANVLVSFSTQAGKIAEDKVNGRGHSPYAIALNESLPLKKDIRKIMGSVRVKVAELTNNQQIPIGKDLLGGDDYCLSGCLNTLPLEPKVIEKIVYRDRPIVVEKKPKEERQESEEDNSELNNITVIDELMWHYVPYFSDNRDMNWYQARAYCQNLILGEYGDWRLPSKDMLERLFKKFDKDEPYWGSPEHKLYQSIERDSFFSSSPIITSDYYVWGVSFEHGTETVRKDSEFIETLCVREQKGEEKELRSKQPIKIFHTEEKLPIRQKKSSMIKVRYKKIWQDEPINYSKKMSQSEAISYCQTLRLGGYSDWELPETDDISEIERYGKDEELTYKSSDFYWVQNINIPDTANDIVGIFRSFDGGTESKIGGGLTAYVRCIRKGEK